MIDRRSFLKSFGLLGLSYLSPNVFAKDSVDFAIPRIEKNNDKPIMLFIFLRGGADGLSMISPYSDPLYYEYRPHVSLPKDKGLIISSEFSVNPLLKESFYDAFNNNQAIFIPAAGQDHNSRSHFLSEDYLTYGANMETYNSGFLNRFCEVTQLNGVSFTASPRTIFKGVNNIPCFSLDEINFTNSLQEEKIIQSQYQSDDYHKKSLETLSNNKAVLLAIKKSSEEDFNQVSQFKRFARFMSLSNSNVGYVQIEGWDTHTLHNPINSELSKKIENLNSSLTAYKQNTTTKDWDRTFIIIFSEFGRTVKENGSNGTEHGHGNLMTILGGGIKKSKIAGDWLTLSELHENRDIHSLLDNNLIFANIFKTLYGLSNNQIKYIFPNTSMKTIDIV